MKEIRGLRVGCARTPQVVLCSRAKLARRFLCSITFLTACGPSNLPPVEPSQATIHADEPAPDATAHHPRVIVMVWDGLRPDSIDPEVTPRLAQLRDQLGVDFRDHHSVYPTFTMMNAAALATGVHSGT